MLSLWAESLSLSLSLALTLSLSHSLSLSLSLSVKQGSRQAQWHYFQQMTGQVVRQRTPLSYTE